MEGFAPYGASLNPLYFKHILLSYKTRQMDKTQVVNLWSLFSGTYINISNDNILQIQIIWITTIAKIEDNITG
jgi:hypothetical protein